jgi:hypothetical protein
MGLNLIPKKLREKFTFDEREHAVSILAKDFPHEWADILACLDSFWLTKTAVMTKGGGKSPISMEIDGFLQDPKRGWAERKFDTKLVVDGVEIPSPTHRIDNFKNRVGLEIEWNNKDPFFDRDLNNFRLLRQLHVLSVGVIITRMSELQSVFNQLGKGASYGQSTTHWNKLIPKVDGGGAGGCPLLMIGLGMACYRADA